MLTGAHDAVVGSIDVHLTVIRDVPRDTGTLKHMQVFTAIGDSRHVIKILPGGFTILPAIRVNHHDSGACC